jgi:glycosyltransferase involved in cell wall biosynthesis
MRVLLVTDWPAEGGGVETYLGLIARGLRAAGDEVRLMTSSVGGGARVADYVAFGTRHPALQSVLQIANPAAARTLRRALREFRPDVVHVSMFEMHLSPSVLAALHGVPTVVSIAYYKPICPNGLKLMPDDSRCTVPQGAICWRGGCFGMAHWLRDRPRYARIRGGIRRAAAVITCSRSMQRELATAGIDAQWSPWPIEAPSADFRRRPATDPLFVCSGRLSREKGVTTLVSALARVRSAGTPARLRLVGDGPERPALERLAGQLGVSDAVEFTGWLAADRVEPQLADAWALVAPSIWAEPLGLTALEAIVRGVPVIASRIGGFSETVDDGVTGMLFPNGDAAALAECLTAVATGRALVAGVPDATRERLQSTHDLDRHVVWLRALFEGVLP